MVTSLNFVITIFMLTRIDIIRSRLSHLLLDGDHSSSPQDIVEQLVAVQAQDYYASIWSIGLRMADPTSFGEIEDAFNSGAILRTHLLRPTWHFVSPKDIRWLLALTGPRVQSQNAFMYRREEIDPGLIRKSNDLIASALAGNNSSPGKRSGKFFNIPVFRCPSVNVSHTL